MDAIVFTSNAGILVHRSCPPSTPGQIVCTGVLTAAMMAALIWFWFSTRRYR